MVCIICEVFKKRACRSMAAVVILRSRRIARFVFVGRARMEMYCWTRGMVDYFGFGDVGLRGH